MRIARALAVIAVSLLTVTAVPAAQAHSRAVGTHIPTALRDGTDARQTVVKANKASKNSRAKTNDNGTIARILAERRALAPVIEALDSAFTKLPSDSAWRSYVLRIRDCMEMGVESLPPHLEPVEGLAPLE